MKLLLKGITILDFSTRLPGPLASYTLAQMGAKVIKVEDINYQDPFVQGPLAQCDISFPSWYKSINSPKEIIRLDLNSQKNLSEVKELLKQSDGVILGLPQKMVRKLQLDKDSLENKNLVAIKLLAGKDHTHLHDINALGLSGALKMHVSGQNEKWLRPPFVPLAGILFSQKIAQTFLAGLYQREKLKKSVYLSCSLLEASSEILNVLWNQDLQNSNQTTFLHNGAFPCYCLYLTKDQQYVALGAIEEILWSNFCQEFKINLGPQDRFNSNPDVFQKVSQILERLDQKEILRRAQKISMCLTGI